MSVTEEASADYIQTVAAAAVAAGWAILVDGEARATCASLTSPAVWTPAVEFDEHGRRVIICDCPATDPGTPASCWHAAALELLLEARRADG